MKVFKTGDRVQVRGKVFITTSQSEQVVSDATGVIVALEETANGERGARVAIETPLGLVAKLVFTRQLRRA